MRLYFLENANEFSQKLRKLILRSQEEEELQILNLESMQLPPHNKWTLQFTDKAFEKAFLEQVFLRFRETSN
jgi:hypothetical protein